MERLVTKPGTAHGPRAFSLIELLVALATSALLAGMLLTVCTTARERARKLGCLNNLRQLQSAWLHYAYDAGDRLIAIAWVPGDMSSPVDATNTMRLAEGALYPYCPATRFCKCPADRKPNAKSQVVTVRSYALNTYLNGSAPAADLERVYGVYRVATRLSHIVSPPPTRRLVFVDESQNTLDDCAFEVIPSLQGTRHGVVNHWNNYPAARHGNRAMVSFADGHVAAMPWTGPLLQSLEARVVPGNYTAELAGADLQDLRRVQDALALPADPD